MELAAIMAFARGVGGCSNWHARWTLLAAIAAALTMPANVAAILSSQEIRS